MARQCNLIRRRRVAANSSLYVLDKCEFHKKEQTDRQCIGAGLHIVFPYQRRVGNDHDQQELIFPSSRRIAGRTNEQA